MNIIENPFGLSDRCGSKSIAAYTRAKKGLITAWGQGVRQKPLSGDALWYAELLDGSPRPWSTGNIVREKYQRGLDRLPFED